MAARRQTELVQFVGIERATHKPSSTLEVEVVATIPILLQEGRHVTGRTTREHLGEFRVSMSESFLVLSTSVQSPRYPARPGSATRLTTKR